MVRVGYASAAAAPLTYVNTMPIAANAETRTFILSSGWIYFRQRYLHGVMSASGTLRMNPAPLPAHARCRYNGPPTPTGEDDMEYTMLRGFLCAVAMGIACAAGAQQYPAKPIRIVIPFPPGNTMDIMARLIGPKITERLGQNVIVDNRAGAAGQL